MGREAEGRYSSLPSLGAGSSPAGSGDDRLSVAPLARPAVVSVNCFGNAPAERVGER